MLEVPRDLRVRQISNAVCCRRSTYSGVGISYAYPLSPGLVGVSLSDALAQTYGNFLQSGKASVYRMLDLKGLLQTQAVPLHPQGPT